MHPGFKWKTYLSNFGSLWKDHNSIFNFASVEILLIDIHLSCKGHYYVN